MIFTQIPCNENKKLQILAADGKVVDSKRLPKMNKAAILEGYRLMMYSRMADLQAYSYQRQGRLFTFPPNYGQEAAAVGSAMAIEKADWLVPAYRELGAWLRVGATVKDFFLYWAGHEDGATFPGAPRLLPPSVPIASQLLHATGIGYAIKYRRENAVVFTYVGDGGTSEGEFHEALNYASVWKVPVVFIVQNNHYAISAHKSMQSNSMNFAIKSVAYGIPGLLVDGNDFFAAYVATSEAATYARKGNGPVLLELETYRRGPHTTSDDPSKYRSKEEEEDWAKRDPIDRLRTWLIAKKYWSKKKDEDLQNELREEIDQQFGEVENYPAHQLEDVFKYHFEEMPDDLKKQMVAYKNYLNWRKEEGQ
jgi:pyruvate dehydrogenase E1 component alpha subunit